MYSIIFLLFFISFLLFFLFKLLNINKNYTVCILITILILLFVSNLKVSIDAALTGLNLVIKTILPTIFPFAVICNLLISYDGISLYSKLLGPLLCKPLKLSKNSSFPIVASIISGYPLGCKYCCDLYELGYIERNEFERLLNIASNCSPMFIIGSIGVSMLHSIKLGFILLIANYLSPLIIGIITIRKSNINRNQKNFKIEVKEVNMGTALKTSIDNGITTTLQVGAFVILFSIIISIIKNNAYTSIIFNNLEAFLKVPKYSIYGFFLGSIEFTNGCKLITETALSLSLRLSIISFICSFSGISVIAQISSFTGKYNVSLKKYTFWKLIQGFISFIITFIITSLINLPITTSNITTYSNYNNPNIILYIIIMMFLLCTFIYCYKRKLHSS